MRDGMAAGKSQLDPWRKRLDPLRERMEIFISGPAPSDPLYLTNRTWWQKLKLASLIAAPVLLAAVLVTIAVTNPVRFHKVEAYAPPPAEGPLPAVSEGQLPDPVAPSTDLEVVNTRISKDAHPPVVTGTVRNLTGRNIDSAQVTFYLADAAGSMVGADTTEVANVRPYGSVAFRMPLKIARAEYVIVRDVQRK
jgi:hypothetical protein